MSLIRSISAFDVIEDVFFVFDGDSTLQDWNHTVVEVTGYDETELSGMSVLEFFDADDRSRVLAAQAEVLETGDGSVEADLITADGDRLPYEFRATRLPEDAEMDGYAGIGRDISERREAEQARRDLLNRMTDAFFAVDTDCRVTYLNEQAERILAPFARAGLEFEDLLGERIWDAFPGATETTFYDEYYRALDGGEPVVFEERFEAADAWFEVRLYPSETGVSVFFRNVTAQHRHREALEERATVLKRMYQVISDRDRSFGEQVETLLEIGCETLDIEYGLLARVEGEEYVPEVVYAPEDLVKAGDVLPLSATNCERVVATEETLVLSNVSEDAPELTDRAAYQEFGIACYLGAPVFCDEEVYGTLCFTSDGPREPEFEPWEQTVVDLMSQWVSYGVTRRQANERLAEERDRMEQFASIVTHDLRNPLSILESWLNVLAEADIDPETEATALEHCGEATDRMETLIEDLLVLARAGELRSDLAPVDLSAAADRAWDAVTTHEATLHVETDRTVSADRTRLQQLLENLFRNAVEHGGESVTVTVGDLPEEDGFYIADDGPGIPQTDRETVFERGYSTRSDGTGFGLSIVEEVSRGHGWELRVTDANAETESVSESESESEAEAEAEAESGGARFEFVLEG